MKDSRYETIKEVPEEHHRNSILTIPDCNIFLNSHLED